MSFGSVVGVREGHEVPTDASGLAAVLRDHDRYVARLTLAVGAFVQFGDWDVQGYASPVQWLKDQAGMCGDEAYRMVQQAKKLHALPVTAQAWVDGRLSGGQVRIVCTQVIDRDVDLFASHEAALVPELVGLSVDETLAAMRLWRARADALAEGPEPDDRSTAHLSSTLDNRGVLSANLNAESYATLKEALRIADSNDADTSAALRRGEALTFVAKFFLDHHDKKLRNRNRPHVNVVINAATLGADALEGYYAATGMRATPATLKRLLCDCDLHRMLHTDGEILDAGRAARLVTPAIWRALVLRDGGCRFPTCDRPVDWCDAHHVTPYSIGGTTTVWDLVMECDHHHHLLHQPGWSSHLARDGTFTVTTPTGTTMTSRARITTQQLDLPPPQPAQQEPPPFYAHIARTRHKADLIIELDGRAA